jgi:hypothetical protein
MRLRLPMKFRYILIAAGIGLFAWGLLSSPRDWGLAFAGFATALAEWSWRNVQGGLGVTRRSSIRDTSSDTTE